MAVSAIDVRVRRALLCAVVVIALVTAVAPHGASATENVTTSRLAGENRYETAGGIAVSAFPSGATNVVLASGETFPDALAGSALAGAVGGPIVLTARDRLSPAAEEAIEQLDPDNVIVLGGTAAVSDAAASEVTGAQVTRVSGADRYATAAAAARRIGAAAVADLNGLRTAIVASGTTFADALAGGGIANNGEGNGVYPVLLVDDDLPAATSSVLEELEIEQALILGGTAAVSAAIETELEAQTGNPAVRVAGANRYATAASAAELMIDELASPGTSVLLANGESFADALAAGVLSGVRLSPIVLTPQPAITDETEDFLQAHEATVAQVIAIGGTAAVSQTALEQAERAAETAPEGEAAAADAITVAPSASSSQRNNTTRTYTASGLTGVDEVDIALVPCNNVTSTSGGRSFKNSNSNAIADGAAEAGSAPDKAATSASISSVNGAARTLANNDYADDVAPKSDGTVTFIVSGPSSTTAQGGCVRPVVFVDADADAALDVTTANPGSATEDVGVGGSTTFSPNDASGGGSGGGGGSGSTPRSVSAQDVSRHSDGDEDANQFEACEIARTEPELANPEDCAIYKYDENDSFKMSSGETLTFADWETRLSPGDDVSATKYFSSRSGQSVFTLVDEAPGAPQILDARESDGEVTITFREPNDAVDSFRLYRLKKSSSACPTARSAYGQVIVAEDEQTLAQVPGALNQTSDDTVQPGTTYCYILVSEDDDDESAPSAPAEVATEGEAPPDDGEPTLPTLPPQVTDLTTTTGGGGGSSSLPSVPATPTTPTTPTTEADEEEPPAEDLVPTIDAAEGDNVPPPSSSEVSLRDRHRFTFSERMSPTIVTAAYDVTDGSGNVATIVCSAGSCSLSADGTVLLVTLTQPVTQGLGVPFYPVEVTDTTGFVDPDGNEVDLAGSDDVEIGANDFE